MSKGVGESGLVHGHDPTPLDKKNQESRKVNPKIPCSRDW